MDISNPTYRQYSERLIQHLVEHYRDNPYVIGWQIDNETSAYGASNPDVVPRIRCTPQEEVRHSTEDERGVVSQLLGRGRQQLG